MSSPARLCLLGRRFRERGAMLESLAESEIRALATVFHQPVRARQLLEVAGLPRSRQPAWQDLTAEEFWREVSAVLVAGALPDGRRRVLAAARQLYPANPALASAVHPPDELPGDDSPHHASPLAHPRPAIRSSDTGGSSLPPCPPWVAMLTDDTGRALGSAFLVDAVSAVTQARLLSSPFVSGNAGPPPPTAFRLVFPALRITVRASVPHEVLTQAHLGGGDDVTLLRLTEPGHDEMRPPGMRTSRRTWGHRFRVAGYSPDGGREFLLSGILRGPAGPQWTWVRMEGITTEGVVRGEDYGGAPVWDEELHAVVGMVITAEQPQPHDILSMLPIERIAKKFTSVASVDLDDRGPAGGQLQATILQLPPDIADFVGREDMVTDLEHEFERAVERSAPVVITAVAGKPGVGKTALAVHTAHRLLPEFPDGALYVNLRGAERDQASPHAALAAFLRALGVDGAAIPTDPDERAALYRTQLSSRTMLVVLDNAANEAQVRPLLPGRSPAGVLITSRSRLSLLEGVHRFNLDILPLNHALELLTRLVGENRTEAESEAAQQIVELCGRLPLAIRIAGAKLAANEHWALAKLARRLEVEERRLDELSFGDREVRSSFASSYDDRPLEEQRLFRLLGLIQAPSFASWVAAALLDADFDTGEDVLDNLVQAQLVEVLRRDERGRVRYRFHDLLRVFAREKLAVKPAAERKAALGRLLGAYLSLTERASEAYGSEMSGDTRHGAGVRWYRPGLAEAAGAVGHPLDWYVTEQKSLMTAVEQASMNGFWDLSWELARFMSTFLEAQSNWTDWQMTHEVALKAARSAGSVYGEAISLFSFATCRWYQSIWPSAAELFTQALILFRETADLHSQARTLRFLGVVYRDSGQWVKALEYLRQALPVYEAVGDKKGAADTLRSIGVLYRDQNQSGEAAGYLRRALAAYQEMGERQWEARTFRILAVLHLNEEDPASAIACLQKALPVLTELCDRQWEARALRDLASANMQLGNDDDAIPHLEASLAAFSDINDVRGSAYTLENLGRLYAKQDRIPDAMSCFEEAHESFKVLKDLRGEATTTLAIGAIHLRSGRLDAARPWYEHALVLVGRLGDRRREQGIREELQRIDADTCLDR